MEPAEREEVAHILAKILSSEQHDLVEEINRRASDEYTRVKSNKKRELSKYERVISKARKKQIANHASAVASRLKTEFLKDQFSEAIRQKSKETVFLVGYIRHVHDQMAILSSTLESTKQMMLQQSRELQDLQRRLHSTQSSPSSAILASNSNFADVSGGSKVLKEQCAQTATDAPCYGFQTDPLEAPLSLSGPLFEDYSTLNGEDLEAIEHQKSKVSLNSPCGIQGTFGNQHFDVER